MATAHKEPKVVTADPGAYYDRVGRELQTAHVFLEGFTMGLSLAARSEFGEGRSTPQTRGLEHIRSALSSAMVAMSDAAQTARGATPRG